MRFYLSFFLLVFYSVSAQTKLESAMDVFVSSSDLTNASIGLYVVDVNSKKAVISTNEQISLPTASTTKLFSTATALEILGPNYQCETRIYIDGKIDAEGNLLGNLWIRGGGDPSLGSKYFNQEDEKSAFIDEWCTKIKDAGIKTISGRIIADGSEFGYDGAPDGWSWSDMGNYYGSGPAGIIVFDNQMDLYFNTSKYAGGSTEIVKIFPELPGVSFRNEVTSSTNSGDNAYVYGAPFSVDRFVTGTLPMGKSSFLVKGSNPDPEKTLAVLLHEALTNKGLRILEESTSFRELENQKNDYANYTLLFTHLGEKLIDIINVTNMKSVNLFAEQLVCLIGREKKGNGTTESGLKAIEQYWSGKINTTGLFLEDGSGLSRTNAINPSHFCDLLIYMNTSKYKTEFYNSLPISGESGTLTSLCKNQGAHGKIHAKSGTMNRIKSYAGYINSISGKTFAFAIVVNNHNCSSSEIKKLMEPLLNAISAQ